jgi:hypothetical protein
LTCDFGGKNEKNNFWGGGGWFPVMDDSSGSFPIDMLRVKSKKKKKQIPPLR